MQTEWGVKDPWGTHAVERLDVAITIASNMRAAGHDARVVWRGVTDWQDADDHDD